MVNRKLKFLIPRERSEIIPIIFVIILITIYVTFELYVILPAIYNNIFTYKEILHLLFGFYIIFNLIGNLFLCMATDTSVDTIICPVLLPQQNIPTSMSDKNNQQDIIFQHCNWRYCYNCEVNVPPRTQHCHLCKRCILKRDHHCSFLGRCIGFRNIRYYVCFLIWTGIGLCYCNILHVDYTYELVGSFSWRVIVACLFPFGAWLFRILDHFSLLLSFICSTSIVLSLYVLFLTIQQIYLLANGQTWYEYGKNIHIYSSQKCLQSNLEVVFGKRWRLILLSPLIASPPCGDGVSFDIKMTQTVDSRSSQTKRI
ncbi:unnamed protein product [Rotaria socialis]|uniref:Palmitoyltransferase n=1 Tax=Rotaria socialis TaxID=392032 RepID=A0A818IRH3_9BILA|nr:unnamed protein product [Rotaria socialis]CAF3524280.1 unnamed protein product [Rotaria socialis]CAF3543458.1 unnamed protein product [Rotaria socialis]CAF3561235.1 unnamed protein product [Rotaria socialis]CAF3775351.1 unnamed protein product [Rotaria socialis]